MTLFAKASIWSAVAICKGSSSVPLPPEELPEELPLETYRQFSPVFEEDVYPAIDLLTCVSQRNIPGGPAPEAVQVQIDNLKAFVKEREAE